MKKILYITSLLLIGLGTLSCTEMLKEESKTELNKNKYVRNAREALDVLQGVYYKMTDDGMYSYNLSLMFPISTDIAQAEGSSTGGFREVPTNSFNASNSSVQATWRKLYNAIYDANDFIEAVTKNISNFTENDQKMCEIYLGEARALRALFHFELVRWYGNVTIMKSTLQSLNKPDKFVQDDPVAVYEFIEADLKYAAEVLPWSGEGDPRGKAEYRFSKGAALGLLAKVYATWAGYPLKDETKWQKAAEAAYDVVSSMKHSLLPDYKDVWRNTCNNRWDPRESLIEVSFYSPTTEGSLGRIGKWNGVLADPIPGIRGRNAANVKVVYTFMEDWMTKNDPRYEISIARYKYVGENKVYFSKNSDGSTDQKNWQICTPAKWDTEEYVQNPIIHADRSSINWYILRYSDVLLLYAEAVNEWKGNPTTEAVDAINQVRRRGFGIQPGSGNTSVDVAYGLDYLSFRDIVRKERAYELCFEGHRRPDLIRWGVYFETIRETAIKLRNWYDAANYTVVDYTVKGKNELFPIPRREIDLMKNYKQNPNW